MALVETADRPGLVTLANLSDENFAMLRAALNSVSPAENDITGPLTQILALPENQVRDIVSSLMALSAYNLPEADLSRFVSRYFARDGAWRCKPTNSSQRIGRLWAEADRAFDERAGSSPI